jgi:hypothetical protein
LIANCVINATRDILIGSYFLEVNGLKMITSRNVKHGLAWNVEQGMDESIPIQGIYVIIQ